MDLSGLQSHNHNSQQLAIYQKNVFFSCFFVRLISLISGMALLFIHHRVPINTSEIEYRTIRSLPFESWCANSTYKFNFSGFSICSFFCTFLVHCVALSYQQHHKENDIQRTENVWNKIFNRNNWTEKEWTTNQSQNQIKWKLTWSDRMHFTIRKL